MKRSSRNVIWFFLSLVAAGVAFWAWSEFGDVWIEDYGIQAGFYAGIVVGAAALPLIRDPELGGRFVVGAVAGLAVVGVIQLAQFAILAQNSPGLLPTNQAAMTQLGQETVVRLVYGVAGGSIISMFIVAPHLVVFGGILGILIGGLIGGFSHPFLIEQGFDISEELFLFLIGLVTGTILFVFGTLLSTGGSSRSSRRRKR